MAWESLPTLALLFFFLVIFAQSPRPAKRVSGHWFPRERTEAWRDLDKSNDPGVGSSNRLPSYNRL